MVWPIQVLCGRFGYFCVLLLGGGEGGVRGAGGGFIENSRRGGLLGVGARG